MNARSLGSAPPRGAGVGLARGGVRSALGAASLALALGVGLFGCEGAEGERGPAGGDGAQGPQGPRGPAGEAGPPGTPGPPGEVGPPGPPGTVDAGRADTGPDSGPDGGPDEGPEDGGPDGSGGADGGPDGAGSVDGGPEDAGAPDAQAPDAGPRPPCPPFTPPAGLGGPVDSVVDVATARAWLDFRAAREQERLWEAYDPARVAARYRVEQAWIDAGCLSLETLVDVGRGLFMRTFTLAEGYGNALADIPGTEAGDRPPPNLRRFQKGQFGGPDANSCTNCHWKGGFAGSGDRVDASYLYGDGDDVASHDARNPPALWGAGWTERIAAEMTAALQAQVAAAQAEAARTGAPVAVELFAKEVYFGQITARADGTADVRGLQGIDADLVVKPFGWRGVFPTLRDFVQHSTHIHLGMQAEELVAAALEGAGAGGAAGPHLNLGEGPDRLDPDADGVRRELTEGQITALVLFLATLDAPSIWVPTEGASLDDPFVPGVPEVSDGSEFTERWLRGAAVFEQTGCASCHRPFMRVEDPVYRTRAGISGSEVSVDLSQAAAAPRPGPDLDGTAWLVPVFSDFKRHDMGPALAGLHPERGVGGAWYMTRRLWGVGQTGPYLHDGSAVIFDEAVARHGGEAAFAADGFAALSESDRMALRVFLVGMRRAPAIQVR